MSRFVTFLTVLAFLQGCTKGDANPTTATDKLPGGLVATLIVQPSVIKIKPGNDGDGAQRSVLMLTLTVANTSKTDYRAMVKPPFARYAVLWGKSVVCESKPNQPGVETPIFIPAGGSWIDPHPFVCEHDFSHLIGSSVLAIGRFFPDLSIMDKKEVP